jgi:hypothetical protein
MTRHTAYHLGERDSQPIIISDEILVTVGYVETDSLPLGH